MTQFKYRRSSTILRHITIILFCVFLLLFISILWFYPIIDRWLNGFELTSGQYSTVKISDYQTLQGEIIREQNVSVARFLGVPYADTPKRFKKPSPHPGWTGNRKAMEWPPFCKQKSLHQYTYITVLYQNRSSEDCLYMNIWSPHKNLTSTEKSSELLPVVVFIHGGAFRYMGISMEAHEGSIYSAVGNVVFVAINYRVGLFGFLDTEMSSEGYAKNVGLYDQEMALRWIGQNINKFGGDPRQITIQGQSAGAISAGLHMLSHRSNKLFHRAIMQSGSAMMAKQLFRVTGLFDLLLLGTGCNTTFINTNEKRENIVEYEEESSTTEESSEVEEMTDESLKDSESETLKQLQCLEQLDSDELIRAQEEICLDNILAFSPTIPSDFIPEFPAYDSYPEIFQNSVMIGADANETGLFLHHTFPKDYPLKENFTVPEKTILKTLRHFTGVENVKSLADSFINGGQNVMKRFFSFLNDFSFKGPVLKFTKFLEQRSTPVYLYMFSESNKLYPKWVGASHWLEMDYVFGIPLRYPDRFTKEQQDLSRRMIQSFGHFARTGKSLPQLGVEWPEYSSETNRHMTFKSNNASLGAGLDMTFYSLFDVSYDAS